MKQNKAKIKVKAELKLKTRINLKSSNLGKQSKTGNKTGLEHKMSPVTLTFSSKFEWRLLMSELDTTNACLNYLSVHDTCQLMTNCKQVTEVTTCYYSSSSGSSSSCVACLHSRTYLYQVK